MTKQGRRTQPERRAETERRVLDAATVLIARKGSRSVSLAEVGRAAGYSRGIVTHQFGSREHLLAAVVTAAQQFEVSDRAGTGLDQLAELVATYLTNLRERAPAGQAFLIMWTEAVAADPVLQPIFAERDAWFRGVLADHLRRGIADGSIRSNVDPVATSITLLGLMRGIGLQMAVTSASTLEVIAVQTVSFVRHGLSAVGC